MNSSSLLISAPSSYYIPSSFGLHSSHLRLGQTAPSTANSKSHRLAATTQPAPIPVQAHHPGSSTTPARYRDCSNRATYPRRTLLNLSTFSRALERGEAGSTFLSERQQQTANGNNKITTIGTVCELSDPKEAKYRLSGYRIQADLTAPSWVWRKITG